MIAYRFQTAISPRLIALGLLAGATAACSSGDSSAPAQAAASDDPPGAALPLSIGGRAASEGEGLYDTSVNCAAALGITGERLAQMSSNSGSREMQLITRAKDHFTERATEAQLEDRAIVTSAVAAIARRRTEKADETSQQAQLAIACLRRFGDDVGEV